MQEMIIGLLVVAVFLLDRRTASAIKAVKDLSELSTMQTDCNVRADTAIKKIAEKVEVLSAIRAITLKPNEEHFLMELPLPKPLEVISKDSVTTINRMWTIGIMVTDDDQQTRKTKEKKDDQEDR
jgi:hypothetical protein